MAAAFLIGTATAPCDRLWRLLLCGRPPIRFSESAKRVDGPFQIKVDRLVA
jgi:hypothetical protein